MSKIKSFAPIFFNEKRLKQLGVVVDRKGKLPDVVLYLKSKNWIIVILVSFTKLAQMITILKKTMMENVGGIFSTKKSQKAVKIK